MVLYTKAIFLSLVAIPLGCIALMIQCSPAYRKQNKTNRDVEKQQEASSEETATMLKWAASSNNLQALKNIIHGESGRERPGPDAFGVALIAAIQNNHVEAAKLIINNKEGLQYRDDQGAMPLHWAARRGHVSICQELLQLGVPLNEENAARETALDWAMEGGDDATINFLLKGEKQYTRVDTLDMQSIHFSARMGDLDMVKSLYKKTKTLEMRDARGQTVLFHAIKGKQLAIVQWLLEEGRANVGAVDKEGLTALHVAADMSDADSARLLIDHGANVNARSNLHLTPLHMITNAAGHLVLSLLVGNGAIVEAECKHGDQPLHKAASAGEEGTPILKLLSQYGADLAAKGASGNTAAHCAAACGCSKTLEVLVDESIDIKDCRNTAGYTPLMVAAQARATDTMTYLLGKGASPNVSDAQGHSLVELSVGWGDPLVISILRNHGAEFGDLPDDKTHPVWDAISDGQTRRAMEQLLDAGLSMEYARGGVTLLQHALEAENTEVSTLLLERGASVDTRDRYGWSALHSAAFAGVVSPLLLVLQRVSDREPKDNQGWTPSDLAAFYGHKEAMSVLDPKGKIEKFVWMKEPDQTTFWSQHSDVGVRDFAYSEAGFQERHNKGLVFEAPGD
ncbi:hypothetical protein INS49_012005 [Diaporthe citri]|uniref:uncharacterized protein n=1 Tax=Diaporthe citri TaxID=83186 RepID=UPI001C8160CB|nr:uncharacterized protein INS49_012005 [Diaporthe citri]KAG6360937.1 hypothetical protein INS49_012005 [Diaporthe citri]